MGNKTIEKLKRFFSDKPVKKAYIFGSSARGNNGLKSDIDIIVELDYSKHIGLKFVSMKLELENLLNKKVDLLTGKSISKHIKPFIDKDKILIYEK